jgi:4-hydroxy 2-oxovalerate aldolase
LIESEFIPLQKKLEWGYLIPYAITGILDEHPRDAMALRKSDRKDGYRAFYDSLIAESNS